MKPHNDVSGRPLAPGDIVVFSANYQQSCVLRYGVVTRLAVNPRGGWEAGTGKRVPSPTVRVIAAGWGYDYRDHATKWRLFREGGESALQYVDRMLVVDRHQVPREVLELMDPAYRAYLDRTTPR